MQQCSKHNSKVGVYCVYKRRRRTHRQAVRAWGTSGGEPPSRNFTARDAGLLVAKSDSSAPWATPRAPRLEPGIETKAHETQEGLLKEQWG